MFLNNAMDRINRLIIQGGRTGMTELQFFAAEIKEWKDSPRRKDQLRGDLYYEGQHDILKRQRTIIGEDGKLQVVNNLPNNRLIDNQYALMVDQKTNYLVGKPFTLNCQDKSYTDALGKIFNKRFYRLLKYVCEDALNGGLGWVYPYYTDAGELAFKHFPAYDILPFWADDDHTILDCAVRYYTQEVWNGYTKEKVEKVEIFKTDGIYRYIYQNDMLIADVEAGEHENYFMVEEEGQEPKGFNWTRIPLIPFKYNKQEIPLIRRVKTLQDGINVMLSDFENNMQEDARNTILVLKNYDGENLGEFRHNLSTYGAVKVREDGGVETLQVEINGAAAEAREAESLPLAGKVFAFTGALKSMGRSKAKEIVEGLGARTSASVTRGTDFLVSDGKSDGDKAAKAREYGTRVLSEDEFLKMVEGARPAEGGAR